MKTLCLIVLFAVFAAIDAQGGAQGEQGVLPPRHEPPEVPPFGGPTPDPEFMTVEPWEPADPTSPPNNPAVMRGWNNQQQQGGWPNQQQDPQGQEDPDSESGEDFDTTDAPDAQDYPDAPGQVAGGQAAAGAGQISGEQAGSPVNFINMGGKPFKGFKKPTKQDAQTIAGKTIGIILSTLFLIVAAAVVAVIVIRKRRSA